MTPNGLGPILPDALYPLAEFYRTAGVGKRFLSLARRKGIAVPLIRAGRRSFIRGATAIAIIEEVARQQAPRETDQEPDQEP